MRLFHTFRTFNWKLFSALFVPGLIGVLAVLPYVFEMLETLPIAESDIPLPLIVMLSLLQNGILLAVAVALGMVLSARVGLDAPLFRAWTAGEPVPPYGAMLRAGAILGGCAGAILVLFDAVLFLPDLPEGMQALFEIPLWKRLLAGVVYGGITEELLMRLFLMSLFVWVIGRWWKTAVGMPTTGAFWTAIVLTAIIFGLGHLPATAAFGTLTQSLVVRALLLNGVAGVAFGYLYWRHGLEAAMLGHMSTHVVMQGPGVMLLETLL